MEGRKPEYLEKNVQSTGENQKTQLAYDAGIEPRTIVVRGKGSHCFAPCASLNKGNMMWYGVVCCCLVLCVVLWCSVGGVLWSWVACSGAKYTNT